MIRHKNISREIIITMEHPYRVHSSIGFGFLQLLMLSSLAYPTPPPPLYHNIALIRMMGTVYFTMFHDKPIYLKLECVTILLEIIRDTLYVWYIIRDYTYIFGVFDIVGNALFCIVIVLSLSNGEEKWDRIQESFEGMRKTCLGFCWRESEPTYDTRERLERNSARELDTRSMKYGHIYSSLPSDDKNIKQDEPIYTYGRQAFKPSFYSSSWGRDYLNHSVNQEFDKIDYSSNTKYGDIGMVTSTDGQTQYIRFDESESSSASASHHYANIFVSPYVMKDGTLITSFSEWTRKDTIGVCLFIYNLFQFIYQLMIYNSIIKSCREYHAGEFTINETTPNERLMKWLC